MDDQELERQLKNVGQKLKEGYAVGSDQSGNVNFLKIDEPQTSMGVWTLRIITPSDEIAVCFNHNELRRFAVKIVGAL